MEKSFKDTYTNETEKNKEENVGKIVLSNDGYAVAEVIAKGLELLRLK